MGKRIDIDSFIKYLENRGGGIHAVRAGQVASRLANVIGVPPYSVGQFLKRMEEKGLIIVDRGQGGRFIYGVSLRREIPNIQWEYGRPDSPTAPIMLGSSWFMQGEKAEDIYAKAQILDKWDNAPDDTVTADMLQTTGTVDYSVLAGKLLEKATDAIAENDRLKERIKYLEGKVQEQPSLQLSEQRHNVIKDLMKQVGTDAE